MRVNVCSAQSAGVKKRKMICRRFRNMVTLAAVSGLLTTACGEQTPNPIIGPTPAVSTQSPTATASVGDNATMAVEGRAPASGNVAHAVPASAWPTLTQSQRGDAIYAEAIRDVGKDHGNCKEWARAKILAASSGLVNIPATLTSDKTKWVMPHKYVFPIAELRNAIHGDVLQMVTYNSTTKTWLEHTAIVISIVGDEIKVIDANWLSRTERDRNGRTRRIGIVGVHSWSISNFLMNPARARFTLYRIGGGQ